MAGGGLEQLLDVIPSSPQLRCCIPSRRAQRAPPDLLRRRKETGSRIKNLRNRMINERGEEPPVPGRRRGGCGAGAAGSRRRPRGGGGAGRPCRRRRRGEEGVWVGKGTEWWTNREFCSICQWGRKTEAWKITDSVGQPCRPAPQAQPNSPSPTPIYLVAKLPDSNTIQQNIK